MQIRGEGLVDESGEPQGDEDEQQGKILYVVHPNCAVEDV